MRAALVLPFLLLSTLVPTHANSQETLTLEQAVSEALQANLTLQAEGKKLEAKNRDKTFAFQKLFPTITAGAGYLDYNDLSAQQRLVGFVGSTPVLYPTEALNFGVALNAQFTLSLATFATMDQTLADYEAGRVSYEITKQNLTRNVKKTFYHFLALQQARNLLKKEVENSEARYVQVKSGYDNGASSEQNLLQAEVARENKKNDLRALEANLKQVSYVFCLFLGRPKMEVIPLKGEIEPHPPRFPLVPERLADKYLSGRLDLAEARAQKKALDVQTAETVFGATPQLVLGYSADPGVNDPFNQNWSNSTNWHQQNGGWTLQLQWKLDDFLPGSSYWTSLADLDDKKMAIDLTQKQTRDAALLEIQTLADKITDSTQSLDSLQRIAVSAERAAQLAQKAFTDGVENLLDAQDADLQSQAAQLALLNEKLALIDDLIDLEFALNTPLEDIDELK